jgi:hypothetical protein
MKRSPIELSPPRAHFFPCNPNPHQDAPTPPLDSSSCARTREWATGGGVSSTRDRALRGRRSSKSGIRDRPPLATSPSALDLVPLLLGDLHPGRRRILGEGVSLGEDGSLGDGVSLGHGGNV